MTWIPMGKCNEGFLIWIRDFKFSEFGTSPLPFSSLESQEHSPLLTQAKARCTTHSLEPIQFSLHKSIHPRIVKKSFMPFQNTRFHTHKKRAVQKIRSPEQQLCKNKSNCKEKNLQMEKREDTQVFFFPESMLDKEINY